jgi:sigma-B regulation protein RsbU (phosphoserine phosphatase)
MRLEKEGYKVSCAYNGREALDIVKNEQPDLVLSDVIMPELDGFEFCKRVKNDDKLMNIPIVLITSLSSSEDKVKGLESGCDDFLSKPINDIELVARVRSLLKLKDYTDELAIKNITFQKEIQLAGKVQEKIIPSSAPDLKAFDIDFIYIPCYSVGGDFFYFFKYSDSKLGVFLADVVGHGIQAALITMILKTLLDNFLKEKKDPVDLLHELNSQLISILGGKFTYVTAMFAILDAESNEITYSSAGHPAGFLYRDGEVNFLKTKGYVMGLFENAVFKNSTAELKPGDKILLYTDGAFEAEDEDYNIFGDERLLSTFKRNGGKRPKEINTEIINELENFVGDKMFSDDVNLISIGFKG